MHAQVISRKKPIAILMLFLITMNVPALAVAAVNHEEGGPAFKINLPVTCQLGNQCFIQQYPDIIPGPGYQDFMCGSASYDGHKGTDFRLISANQIKQNYPVIAAADGVVTAVRDGMPDQMISSMAAKQAVKGKECGNGVVIDHGQGYQTQYCHLRQNSIQVIKGQTIKAGNLLGFIGYSGEASFPHLHFSLQKNQQHLDPFSTRPVNQPGNCQQPLQSYWSDRALVQLQSPAGRADAQMLSLGFSSKVFSHQQIRHFGTPVFNARSEMPALVLHSWLINLKKHDRVHMTIRSPKGTLIDVPGKPLDRNKSDYFLYIGKKLPENGWEKGIYQGSVKVLRKNKIIRQQKVSFSM